MIVQSYVFDYPQSESTTKEFKGPPNQGVTNIFTFTFYLHLFDTWFAALSANYLLLFFDS